MVGWRKAARSRFRPQKRRFEGGSSWEDGIEMKEMFSQALTLQDAPCTFDMDEVVERAQSWLLLCGAAMHCWTRAA